MRALSFSHPRNVTQAALLAGWNCSGPGGSGAFLLVPFLTVLSLFLPLCLSCFPSWRVTLNKVLPLPTKMRSDAQLRESNPSAQFPYVEKYELLCVFFSFFSSFLSQSALAVGEDGRTTVPSRLEGASGGGSSTRRLFRGRK